MLRHLAAGACFLLLAVAWTLPLSLHLSTHLPGPAIGDNAVFLWNFWWMRTALATGADFFHTDYLFAPAGTDLTLHTHAALPAFAGATLLRPLPLVTALNLTTLASLALNGFCAYLLAWRVTGERAGAIVAGIVFGCSPFIAAHMTGHFNLTTAWTIPLFALAWIEAVRRGSTAWPVLAGVLLGATAYIDYYLLTYAAAFAICVWLLETRTWSVSLRARQPARRLLMALGVLILADLAVIAAIVLTGGFVTRIGPLTIAARGLFNPVQALSVLTAAAAVACLRPRVRATTDDDPSSRPGRFGVTGRRRGRRAFALMLATVLVIDAPIAWHVVRLIVDGQYVTQQYYWRSAPAGIDLATLVLGNPFHGFWGGAVRDLYARLDINAVESVAWPGVVSLLLGAYALRRCWHQRAVRCWTAIAVVFFIWALGSHVFVAGRNTAVLTPAAVLQFIPIVSNARMPGRAMVMVYLAMAMLAASATKEYRTRNGGWVLPAFAAAFVLVDLCAAPFPITPLACPPMYQTLHDRPERGAVAELPLGFGDGFGGVTPADNRTMLACQTVHGRPLVGGFIARLSPRVLAAYREDALLSGWMRLSGAAGFEDVALPSRDASAERLRADGIAFIVIDRAGASEALLQSVSELPVVKIEEDERRSMYLVSN